MIIVFEVVAGLLLAGFGVMAILAPIIRAPARSVDLDSNDDELEAWEIEEDLTTPKAKALAALKEIEFDRATGKLDDEDYGRLKNRYTRLAIEAMREEETSASPASGVSLDDLAEAQIQAAAQSMSHGGEICPDCGIRPETEAKFCSNCGKSLVVAMAS